MDATRRSFLRGLLALPALAVLPKAKPLREEPSPYSIPSFVNEHRWVNSECLSSYEWRYTKDHLAWSTHEIALNR